MQKNIISNLLYHTISSNIPSPIDLSLSSILLDGHLCDNCGLSFTSLSDLETHLTKKEKPVQCSLCNENFSTILGMKKHYGKIHEKYRPSRCNQCKKRFRNKYAAKRHILQVHQETSRISCDKCGKILYNKFSLSRHYKICD
jgi:DNA-directed RNA polymerase subunit RPC12/RpoP